MKPDIKFKDLKDGDEVCIQAPDIHGSTSIPGKISMKDGKVYFTRPKKDPIEVNGKYKFFNKNVISEHITNQKEEDNE